VTWPWKSSAEQTAYFEKIKALVEKKKLSGIIKFVGPKPNRDIQEYYAGADLFVHMSRTGSLDKAVLEAMAAGIVVVSCNDAIVKDIFGKYGDELGYGSGNARVLADRILLIKYLSLDKKKEITDYFLDFTEEKHDLVKLIKRITELL